MELLEIKNLPIEANSLRKSEHYKEALNLYLQIEDKDENIISGMANCYRKLGNCNEAVKIINKYIRENQNFDINDNKWFKLELVWSYRDYYLNENFKNKELSLKAANKILEYGDKDNKNLLKSIKKALFTKEILKNYPDKLKEILAKIEFTDKELLDEIKELKENKRNITASIYYNIILTKMKVLLVLNDYKGVLEVYDRFKNILDDLHIERNMAKAVALSGDYDKAISILKKSAIKFGKQFYIFSDIADIYLLMQDFDNALINYYSACLLANDYKFVISLIFNIANLLKTKDKVLAKKHLDLCILIRKKENWSIKDNEKILLEELLGYGENKNIDTLIKELKIIWIDTVNKDVEVFYGVIDKILDNGNGFIRYNENQQIFFRKNKRYNFKKGDKVSFIIEESYDRKKDTYSNAATNLKKHK